MARLEQTGFEQQPIAEITAAQDDLFAGGIDDTGLFAVKRRQRRRRNDC